MKYPTLKLQEAYEEDECAICGADGIHLVRIMNDERSITIVHKHCLIVWLLTQPVIEL